MNSSKINRPSAPGDESQSAGADSEQENPLLEQADLRTEKAELRSEVLRASEPSDRRVFETSQDGILILNATTGMSVDVKPYLVGLRDDSHEASPGKPFWELGFFKNRGANEANFKK